MVQVIQTLKPNHYVRMPVSANAKLVSVIYNHLNYGGVYDESWSGWLAMWRLQASLRVRLFVWKLLHGKVPTCSFSYRLNISQPSLCVFCGLDWETSGRPF